MIFPGHVAACVLCHRYLKTALWPTLIAGLVPDLIDKAACYGLHLSPSSRLPMHTLVAWLASTILVGLLGLASSRERARLWLVSWFVGYGVHLLCDSPLVGGDLPFLWPWRAYSYGGSTAPLSYLFDGSPWPWRTLVAELLLVSYTLASSRRVRAWWATRAARTGPQPDSPTEGG